MALPPIVDRGINLDELPPTETVEVPEPIDFSGGAEVIDDGMGGAVIQAMMADMGMGVEIEVPIEHGANLAEHLDDRYLAELSGELREAYQGDLDSRIEWQEAYTKGLDLLGIKYEERTKPFDGASGITHPLIAESVVQFQAQAYKELLPAGGPVKTQILGKKTPDREAQAARVKDFMNYQITEKMSEYDQDTDQLLFYLPLSGSTFKKTYFDPALQRATSRFVPAQDLVVPYWATDLDTAPRVTHVIRRSANDLRKLMVSGEYRDIDLATYDPKINEVESKIDEIQGTSRSYDDDTYTLLEMHVDLDIEGFEDVTPDGKPAGISIPYIVTIDEGSGEILSIRRNFAEGGELATKTQFFTHYRFMPGLGFYGFGLIHMIGGLSRAATSILRQLIDAGTFSNLPAGFKAKGMRLSRENEPLQPGEFRDIDAPGGSIRDAIIPLPYKEPSGTLAQLLGVLIDGGRRFVSLADEQMDNLGQEAPVGTTMAILERGTKVMSAIHKRLHASQRSEFRILARVLGENLPQEYPYDVAGAERSIFASDFDGRVDVIPVSDPNIFSMAQRVTLAQTQLQLAQSNPQMHNLHAAYRRMYQALEVQNIDEILPPPPEPQPMDPAIENARALMGEFLQTFPEQDHDQHILIHLAFMKTPLVMTSPQVMGTFYAHLMEHASQKARQSVQENMASLIQQSQDKLRDQSIPPEDRTAAEQAIMQLQQSMQDPAQVEALVTREQKAIIDPIMAQIMPMQQDPMNDPLVQIRMKELSIKELELQQRVNSDAEKLGVERDKMKQRAVTDSARLELQEDIAGDRNDVNLKRIEVQQQMARERDANKPG